MGGGVNKEYAAMPDLRYLALATLSGVIAVILLFDGAFTHAICASIVGTIYTHIGYHPPRHDA
jgi:ABC-type enterobactin transport system permease subunit